MFKGLMGKRPTNKSDVVMAVGAAVLAVWKAFDTYHEYKQESENTEKEIES